MSEVVDLVDRNDRPIGTAPLTECLRIGLLHRAIAVLVFRTGGELLLQRRSIRDRWHPGRWTLSCTGHVKAGESYAAAARRELSEELGIKARMRRLVKIVLPKVRSRKLTEWEVVCVFVCRTDLPVRPDPDELEGVKPVSRPVLMRMLNGRALTPDAKILLKRCLSLVLNDPRPGRRAFRFGRGLR